MDRDNGGSAFPSEQHETLDGSWNQTFDPGMTLRDWFAGQALANASICTGTASDWELTAWFGRLRTGITKAEIVARQAGAYADALLAARAGSPS